VCIYIYVCVCICVCVCVCVCVCECVCVGDIRVTKVDFSNIFLHACGATSTAKL
jgi:hypothetical protein